MIHSSDVPRPRPDDSMLAICPDCLTYRAHPVIGVREDEPIGQCNQCGSIFDAGEAVCA